MCQLNRRQASFVVIGVGVVVTIVAAVMAFYGFDTIIETQIEDELVLKDPSGEAFENFQETPIDVFMNFYLFNITNAHDAPMTPDWKPVLQQVGPYVYREKRWKENITFSENKETVRFLQYKSFEFDAERSGIYTEEDKLIMVNTPLLLAADALKNRSFAAKLSLKAAIFAYKTPIMKQLTVREALFDGWHEPLLTEFVGSLGIQFKRFVKDGKFSYYGTGVLASAFGIYSGPPYTLVKPFLPFILGQLKEDPIFLEATAKDLLFTGVRSEFLGALFQFVLTNLPGAAGTFLDSLPPNINPNLEGGGVGFALYPKNNTHDGWYTVYTGKTGLDDYQSIETWNGSPDLEWWFDPECNKIKGTDGTVFKPFLDKKDTLYIFTTDTCRSLYAKYEREVSFLGIDGYRFTIPKFQLENSTVNTDNVCYCVPTAAGTDGCMGAGVINLLKCLGVPVYLSLPHFLNGDEKYLNGVVGLKPNPDIHQTFLDLEPLTGIPLRAAKRVQMNFRIMNFNDNSLSTWYDGLPEDLMVPMLWVDEYGELTPDLADEWKSRIGTPMEAIGIVKWVLLGVGIVVLLIGIVLYINGKAAMRRRKM